MGGPAPALGALGAALCLAACGTHARPPTSTSPGATPTATSISTPSSSTPTITSGGTTPTSPSSTATTTTTTSTTGPGGPLGSSPLSVTPVTGHPTSTLRFAFTPHARSGRVGQGSISFTLIVSGGRGSGCVGAHSEAVPVARSGRPVSARLGPAQLGGVWCPGTYQARVDELARPVCGPTQMCPQFIRLVAVFGPIHFRIVR